MKLFLIELTYYDNFKETDKNEAALVFGNTIADAVKNIQTSFDWISNMNIKVICDDCTPNILYLPENYKDFIQEISNANDY